MSMRRLQPAGALCPPPVIVLSLLHDVATAMQYIHSMHIIHGAWVMGATHRCSILLTECRHTRYTTAVAGCNPERTGGSAHSAAVRATTVACCVVHACNEVQSAESQLGPVSASELKPRPEVTKWINRNPCTAPLPY